MARRTRSSLKNARSARSSIRDIATPSSRNLHASAPRHRSFRPGYALVLGVAAFVGVGVVSAYMTAMFQTPPGQQTPPQPASGIEVQAVLLRAGLHPGALIAAGVESNQLGGMFTRAEAEFGERVETLRSADAAIAGKQQLVAAYTNDVQDGEATQEERLQLKQAQADLKSIEDQTTEVLDAVRSAATATFTENQVRALAALKANSGRNLPMEYLVVERTPEEWVSLRDAISAKRIAERRGEEVPAEALQIIATAEGDPLVSAAKTAITQNTQAVEETWRSAFAEALTEGQGE